MKRAARWHRLGFPARALTVRAGSKPDALREAAAALESLIADLRSLGGAPFTPDTERHPLTRSAQLAATHEETHDPRTGADAPTGNVIATVAVIVTVRDFELLGRLGALLARHEPGWRSIMRAGRSTRTVSWRGLRCALRRSTRPSARAGITRQLSEARYWRCCTSPMWVCWAAKAATPARGAWPVRDTSLCRRQPQALAGNPQLDAPSLDHRQQELIATIEARFTTTGISLVEENDGTPSARPHATTQTSGTDVIVLGPGDARLHGMAW